MLAEQVDRSSFIPVDIDRMRDRISLFGALNDDQVCLLMRYLERAYVGEGQAIFEQEQLPCNIYVVLSGNVELDICLQDGSHSVMNYGPGDCFGETAVIGIQPQLGRAFATKDTELLVLSRSCLLEMVNTDKELFGILMMNIAREVSRRLHTAVTRSVEPSASTSAAQSVSVAVGH